MALQAWSVGSFVLRALSEKLELIKFFQPNQMSRRSLRNVGTDKMRTQQTLGGKRLSIHRLPFDLI